VLTSVEGVYRKGKVELVEPPDDVPDDTRVIVTFLGGRGVDLRMRGMTEEDAAELRARLAAFADDWDSPEMSIYDDYDAALSLRQAGWHHPCAVLAF
jgi:hypothetical protein